MKILPPLCFFCNFDADMRNLSQVVLYAILVNKRVINFITTIRI